MSQPSPILARQVSPQLDDGIVLLYHFSPPDASAILEHVHAFSLSRFPVWSVNTALGFPATLGRMRPRILVLHFSLFGNAQFALGPRFLEFLASAGDSFKVAFFQDEYQHMPTRLQFIDDYGVNSIYTLVEPTWQQAVYGGRASVREIHHTLTGYVSAQLVEAARRRSRPDSARTIDVGYRGRSLPWWMGRGGQEKREIAIRFKEHVQARALPIRLDLGVDENDRLYGTAWWDFLGRSRAFLGVEAGGSIFDMLDVVRPAIEAARAADPTLQFSTMAERVLAPFENGIPYRMVSPRHFEAAAFRVAQVLFEGSYSGVMEPDVHYIALRKDFSNIDAVIQAVMDPQARRRVAERAYEDLIASGRWSYARFITEFDTTLEAAGLRPQPAGAHSRRVAEALSADTRVARARVLLRPLYRRLVPLPARVAVRRGILAARAALGPAGPFSGRAKRPR